MATTSGIYIYETFKPNALKINFISGGILAAVRNTGQDILRELKGVTSTWRHKPIFITPRLSFRGGSAQVLVIVDDDIFTHLNFGTSKRWAVMSSGFIAKTAPGRRVSGTGARPDPVYKGRRQMLAAGYTGPKPGIEARNWTVDIAAEKEPVLVQRVQSAIRDGLRKSGRTRI